MRSLDIGPDLCLAVNDFISNQKPVTIKSMDGDAYFLVTNIELHYRSPNITIKFKAGDKVFLEKTLPLDSGTILVFEGMDMWSKVKIV